MTSTLIVVQETPKKWFRALIPAVAGFIQRQWSELDDDPNDRRVPGTVTVAAVAAFLVLLVSIFSIHAGWNLALGDAQAHLTIARRVTDSLAPGFPQLGTVWLPFPHLLLLPLVQSTFVWHTGWAGAILGACAMAGIAAGIYRICARVGIRRAGRITAVALVIFNSTLLYLCTTAMTEPVLIMLLVASVAGMTRWAMSARDLSAGEMMVFAGLPAAAAMMSRYEGWALVAVGTVAAAILAWRRKRSLRYAVKIAGAYAAWPAMALFWWLIYNFAIYGNPLEFVNGPYSASALQVGISDYGVMSYQGNVGMTLWTYAGALAETVGFAPIVIGVAGVVILVWKRGLSNDALMIWLLAVPSVFIIFAMYAGQTAMSNSHSLPEGLWNNRFALSALPFFSVLGAILVQFSNRRETLHKLAIAGVSLLICTQAAWWLVDLNHSSVIAEANISLDLKDKAGSMTVAEFLRTNYDGGKILMDENAGGNSLLPQIGIPLSNYYNVSTGSLFTEALQDPASHARWVEFSVPEKNERQLPSTDAVYQAVANNSEFLSKYALVFEQGNYRIYRRVSS